MDISTNVMMLAAAALVLAAGFGYVIAKVSAAARQRSSEVERAELRKQNELAEQQLGQQKEQLQAFRDELETVKQERASARENAKSLEVRVEEIRRHQEALHQTMLEENSGLKAKVEQLRETLQGKESALDRLTTTMEEREASHARELDTFNKQKEELKLQFKELSNEILANNSKALQEANQQSLSATINPFKQSIEEFKKQVSENSHRETMQRSELRKELESLKELNLKITTEAHELSTALRGQKKLQGNWGELVLENVLERSGLELDKDYKREVSFTTEEGRQRPDVVVYLPQGKHLIIDAKVSLNAYTRYVNGEQDAERNLALSEHVQAMRDRIRELADRDYYKLPGMNSPEIVFMFVPIESAFVEALKADETLFQEAIANNVLVATPTTLLTSLNIVRQLWRYEDQNKHTVELTKKAEGVFKKLNTFLSSFEGVKKGLDRATEAYVKAEGQLLSGKGNLVKQVGEFKNLAPAIKAELPEYFSEKAELEIDYLPAQEDPETESHIDPKSKKEQSDSDQGKLALGREEIPAKEAQDEAP